MSDRFASTSRAVAVSARAVRRAIDRTPPRYLAGVLDEFPLRCCKPTSQLLARYLATFARVPMVQFVTARRHGSRFCNGGWQSHVWLEAGGMIVDITADQYDEVTSPVIVAESSPWHDTFQVQSRVSYGEMMRMDRVYARRFERTFNRVLQTLEAPPGAVLKSRPIGLARDAAEVVNDADTASTPSPRVAQDAGSISESASSFGTAMLRGIGLGLARD